MHAKANGTLYGLGVGPGDPKLITLRAVEILKSVDVVFAAASPKNTYSLALNTARPHLSPDAKVVMLNFPMTKDMAVKKAAWQDNAAMVLDELEQGRDAAFVTIGDSLTYSTYGYLARTLKEMAPETKLETIPGITAYHAAAARLNLPLVEDCQSLTVVSGVDEPQEIARMVNSSDTVAIMKTYKDYDAILDALGPMNNGRKAYTVSLCGLEQEAVVDDPDSLRGSRMPYLSLMIVKNTSHV